MKSFIEIYYFKKGVLNYSLQFNEKGGENRRILHRPKEKRKDNRAELLKHGEIQFLKWWSICFRILWLMYHTRLLCNKQFENMNFINWTDVFKKNINVWQAVTIPKSLRKKKFMTKQNKIIKKNNCRKQMYVMYAFIWSTTTTLVWLFLQCVLMSLLMMTMYLQRLNEGSEVAWVQLTS